MEKEKRKKLPDDYIRWSGLAFKMMATILAGFWGGRKLDQWIKPRFPIFTLSLGLGAFALSFYSLIKEVTRNK
jgi:hypothetical protein